MSERRLSGCTGDVIGALCSRRGEQAAAADDDDDNDEISKLLVING